MFEKLLDSLRKKLIKELLKQVPEELDQLVRDALSNYNNCGVLDLTWEAVGDTSVDLTPTLGEENAHAFDLRTPKALMIKAGESLSVPLGIKIKLPKGYGALIWSRSGMAAKMSIERGAGLIDEKYADEWILILRNHGKSDRYFDAGDRVAQVFCVPRYKYNFTQDKVEIKEDRGGGLGSTGMA